MGDLAAQLEGLETEPVTPEAPQPDPGQTEAPKLSAFAQEYLNGVDDTERELAMKHVQNWDKGFQKYAQRIAEKYSPYDQLGAFEDVQRAVSIANTFASDPHSVATWLIENGYGPQTQAPVTPAAGDPFEGLPDAVKQRLQEMDSIKPQLQRYETALGAMYQRIQQDEEEKATAAELSKIETGFADAKKTYGDFNEILVLNLMKGGMELEDAVKAITSSVQQGINQNASPKAPRVLSSHSLPPQAKNVNDMTEDERRAGLIAMLEGAMK